MQADSTIIGLVSSVASDRIIVAGGSEADAAVGVAACIVICDGIVVRKMKADSTTIIIVSSVTDNGVVVVRKIQDNAVVAVRVHGVVYYVVVTRLPKPDAIDEV